MIWGGKEIYHPFFIGDVMPDEIQEIGQNHYRVGYFMVESGCLIVSDPCYNDDPHMPIRIPAINGKWWANIRRNNEGRVSELYAVLDIPIAHELFPRSVGNAGVDSGQMGIYDEASAFTGKTEAPYQNFESSGHSDWYLMCCQRTLREFDAGTIPNGVVSSTGYGDGCYTVKACYVEGKAYYVEIRFIEDDWEEFNDYWGTTEEEEEEPTTEEDAVAW